MTNGHIGLTPLQKVLAVDIGNSFTKVGCFIDGHLEAIECLPTEQEAVHPEEDTVEADLIPELQSEVQGIVISSVVPAAGLKIEARLIKQFPSERIFWLKREAISTWQLGAVNLSQYAAKELGTDRIANIIGGQGFFPDNKVMVCDFGTSATFDMIETTGVYLGGAICPGARKFQSLVAPRHVAQLFEVDVFHPPHQTPGLSTQACLENGLYYGYKGMVLEVVGNLLQQSGWPLSQVHFIFTGGDAKAVRDMLTLEIPEAHIDTGLTLKGLYRLWELNQAQAAHLGV